MHVVFVERAEIVCFVSFGADQDIVDVFTRLAWIEGSLSTSVIRHYIAPAKPNSFARNSNSPPPGKHVCHRGDVFMQS